LILFFSMVQSDLFLSVLEYNLKEIAYAADVAQLGYVLMVYSHKFINSEFNIEENIGLSIGMGLCLD